MKLESSLREGFVAAAKAAHRPASQVMRELMREYIQREEQKQAYDVYLAQKVEKGRQNIHEGRSLSNDEVEAQFAARRNA
ncbi:antitoxin of toxin-antitoxin stability system [Erwinia sp. AnSW2-5]|uniref:antitoxin of toxin-antitoxin stability system n=1 Tax=Erwinia sp. AnSW2-5 TaxID=3367692 RepID=UPI00385B14E5